MQPAPPTRPPGKKTTSTTAAQHKQKRYTTQYTISMHKDSVTRVKVATTQHKIHRAPSGNRQDVQQIQNRPARPHAPPSKLDMFHALKLHGNRTRHHRAGKHMVNHRSQHHKQQRDFKPKPDAAAQKPDTLRQRQPTFARAGPIAAPIQ